METDNYWSLVEPVWDTILTHEAPDTFLAKYQAAPEVSRVLFAAHWCQSEVCNGGFGQFFYNSTGVLAPEAAAAFRAVGMRRTADVVERAIKVFKGPYPRERMARQRAMTDIDNNAKSDAPYPFDELDPLFFDLIKTEEGGFGAAADRYAATWRRSAARR